MYYLFKIYTLLQPYTFAKKNTFLCLKLNAMLMLNMKIH